MLPADGTGSGQAGEQEFSAWPGGQAEMPHRSGHLSFSLARDSFDSVLSFMRRIGVVPGLVLREGEEQQ